MGHRDLPFVRGPLPRSLMRRVVTIGPGGSLPYDSDAWRDALIIVDRGAIELHDTAGRRWTFGHGSVLTLWKLPLRRVGNRGPTTAVLVAISLAPAHDKEEEQVLDDKVALIYGPGSIGSTVARAFADAGAQVHLAGRTKPTLDAAADRIRAAGGEVRTRVVDALDPIAVRDHADRVAAEAGRIDICFNLLSHGDVHGTAQLDMDVEDFARPVESMVRSTFIPAQATGRHMVQQGSGLILFFGGTGETPRDYRVGGTMVAFDAQETLRRQLETELGPHGVRAITIVTHGIPESGDPTEHGYADAALIGRTATYDDVGHVAVFAASDQARVMTAATLNISGERSSTEAYTTREMRLAPTPRPDVRAAVRHTAASAGGEVLGAGLDRLWDRDGQVSQRSSSGRALAGVTVLELARLMGTSVAMIERHYGILLAGAGADIGRRLSAFESEQGRARDRATDEC